MNHALVTVVAHVHTPDIPWVRAEIDKLGNPARAEIADALNRSGVVHFVSLNVFEASSGRGGHLVLECSGDGEQDFVLDTLERDLGQWFLPVFTRAQGWSPHRGLGAFWKSRTHTLKQGYFSTIGLGFAGTPGMTVQRIRRERDLARHLAERLPRATSALSVLEEVRRNVRADTRWNWALTAEPTPLLGPVKSAIVAIGRTIALGVATFLWPVLLPMLGAAVLVSSFDGDWVRLLTAEAVVLAGAFAVLIVLPLMIRLEEERDQPVDRDLDPSSYREIARRENHAAQNHICLHAVMKPGLLRRLAIRLFFFAVGQLAARLFKPGFLDRLGTIHFARWILVPGTRDLLFFSNYGGSFESYLEDFITREHRGLTGVWSNTMGFPRAEWLTRKGATDGDRFKRWVRGRQVASLFWYTAYDDITTVNIRNNAAIRQGLAAARTEEEARHWLSFLGSQPRSDGSLEAQEVQGLIYSGFRRLPVAECLFFEWTDPTQSGRWMAAVADSVAYGDRQPERCAMVLGLSPSALHKLGLPVSAINSFPNAFLEGMASPARSRILGDSGANDPDKWWWGGRRHAIDGVVILYCVDEDTRATEAARTESGLRAHGGAIVARVALEPVTGQEPFGFVDGISQPIIKGTRRAQGSTDAHNLVAAGEFILGYADNLGYCPPTPAVEPTLDPENQLALVPGAREPELAFAQSVAGMRRDLGRNGSFLVLRQLEQDVDAFSRKTKELAQDIGQPEEWVAAKIVGRWRNGSSLVRNPGFPASARTNRPAHDPVTDNDFLYGVEDAEGHRCPFGSHIRRANPRDSFDPGSKAQIAISNRHRLLRRGRAYRPQDGQQPGLMFACLNVDLERQFEFIQQTWIGNPSFHGLDGERDPLLDPTGSSFCTVPTPDGPLRLNGLPRFVTVRGGGYFFVPGKRTIEFLARLGGGRAAQANAPGTTACSHLEAARQDPAIGRLDRDDTLDLD